MNEAIPARCHSFRTARNEIYASLCETSGTKNPHPITSFLYRATTVKSG